MLTICSWNVDDLVRLLGDARGAPGLPEIARRLGAPDLLCLQEIRIRSADAVALSQVRTALPGYRSAAAISDDPRNARFRGGRTYGVATFGRAELPGTFHLPGWDREGRLLILELLPYRLAVLNLYGVNGTSKPYWDHDRGELWEDRHAFKIRFQQRLIEEGNRLRARGLDLVLIGDWNVSRSEIDTHPRLRKAPPHIRARDHLNRVVIPELDLVDAFRELHPTDPGYTWFSRMAPPGTVDAARVDYALVSRQLLPRIAAASIEADAAKRFGSDHAPIYLELTV